MVNVIKTIDPCNGDGNIYEYAILVDNSCGLDFQSCQNQMDMVAHIVYTLKENGAAVTYLEFNHNVKIIIPLDDEYYQADIENIMMEVRYGENNCGWNSDGDTDLVSAIQVGVNQLTVFGETDSIKKMIIVSNCMDDSNELCMDSTDLLRRIGSGIEVFVINIAAGKAMNTLTMSNMYNYSRCLLGNDSNICVGNDDGIVSEDEVKQIADQCVLPMICKPREVVMIDTDFPKCDILADSYYDNMYGMDYCIEFVILYDNSCGMKQYKCDEMITGVAEIAKTLMANTNKASVAVLEFTESDMVNIVVDMHEFGLQSDAWELAEKIQQNAQCNQGGNGNLDLRNGLKEAFKYLVMIMISR